MSPPLAPHAPYQAPQSYIDQYGDVPDPLRRSYSAMITALDDQIGRIVAALDRKGLRDNTDHPVLERQCRRDQWPVRQWLEEQAGARQRGRRHRPEPKAPASNAPFRGGKGSLYEGGVRVPAFVNWPAQLKPAVVDAPLHMVDVMPTLLDLAGAKGSPDHPFDGSDMWKTLSAGAPSPNEDILINVEAFRGAVRKGDWKLIKVALLPGRTELYDLAKIPARRPMSRPSIRRSSPISRHG